MSSVELTELIEALCTGHTALKPSPSSSVLSSVENLWGVNMDTFLKCSWSAISTTSHPYGRLYPRSQNINIQPYYRQLLLTTPQTQVPPLLHLSKLSRSSWAPLWTWCFGQDIMNASTKECIHFTPFIQLCSRTHKISQTFSLTTSYRAIGTSASKISDCSI